MTVYHIWIWLKSNEWASHEDGRIMERVAREALRRHADKLTTDSTVVVQVNEHAGWWLTFAVDPDTLNPNDKLVVIGTANDAASLSAKAKRWGEKFKGSHTGGVLESVRRDEEDNAEILAGWASL